MTQSRKDWVRRLILAMCVAGGVVLTAFPSRASGSFGHTTYLTFNRAVALPGVVLPAGSYVFEVASPTTVANLVRVSSRNRLTVHFMGFTRLVQRPAGMPRDRHVTLGEAPAGAPTRIIAWYPADSSAGHEFIYR